MSDTGGLVYVVDDDVSVREGVASLVRSVGLEAKALASGQEFLALQRPQMPSCLVLDVQLPGLSGLDVQEEIVRSGVNLPIIFLTGYGDIQMTVRAIQAGAADFLTKPFEKEDLLSAIRRCFGRYHKFNRQPRDQFTRTRIARELHDTLLQTFLSAFMQLGVAVDSLPSDSPVKPRLDRILQLVDQGIKEGRNTIQGLRSPDSRTVDLVLAFSQVQQEIGVQPEIDFRVIVIGRKQPLRSRIASEVYRIGREALVNAFLHSGAKRVELELEYADADLCMRVRDDGRGIDPRVLHAGREGHWGLAGMRERATRIGARLKVSSSAAHGTEVQLSAPYAVRGPQDRSPSPQAETLARHGGAA